MFAALDRWLVRWHRRRTVRSNAKANARHAREARAAAVTTTRRNP